MTQFKSMHEEANDLLFMVMNEVAPTSDAGKTASAMNNLRHGLYAHATAVRILAVARHRQAMYEELKEEIQEVLSNAKLLQARNPGLHADLVGELQRIESKLSTNYLSADIGADKH